ncbi:Hypothetical predicted protein [Mytilus galloprovincialis]|uniref:Uncharacterized protein n=1 Tax=Mytilus galloprovincialis TaxID=29158 RepID=A0A8B6G2K0_MYTGA|nr:Hypothetical predicted protein [Mytilus galloprovincialis]
MKMVTAPDVDISATSTAETPTSEMSTSYSTNGETKGTDYYRRCTLDRFNRGKHCRSCRTDYHFRNEFGIWGLKTS